MSARCCCPICATVEGVAQMTNGLALVAAASEAWVEHDGDAEMSAAYLRDEVSAALAMKPWRWRSARARLREALVVTEQTPLVEWMKLVPMLANVPRSPSPLREV
jgi:hypothetical protein